MLKRLITAFLALTMVLTMCSGYAVFAAVPAGNNETDGNETVIGFKRIDNFNSYTVDTPLNYNGYPMANQSSDVLVQGAQNGGNIIAGAGRDGSAVLQLNSFGEGNSWRSVRQTTANITMSATDIMMFNFELRLFHIREQKKLHI